MCRREYVISHLPKLNMLPHQQACCVVFVSPRLPSAIKKELRLPSKGQNFLPRTPREKFWRY